MTPATHCTSCKAAIVWAETVAGNRMPLDAGPNPDGNVIAVGHTGEHMVVKVGTAEELAATPADRRYLSHFATCTHPDRHRRRKPKRRA